MLKLTTNMTEPFAAKTNSVYYAFPKQNKGTQDGLHDKVRLAH